MNKQLKKGIYILPSLFTCGNMTFGILSIVSSVNGHFIRAAWFLVWALACDILDGRIARMTNTTSEFGAQLDSFSDLVSFGMAPAMLMYILILDRMGRIGVAIAILFVLCSALRLARFNIARAEGVVRKEFTGLPTPASAGIIISFVLSYELIGPDGYTLSFKTIPILMQTMPFFFKAMPIVMVLLSFLMVSNVPYSSFKKMNLSKPKAIRYLLLVIVLVLLIIVYPQNTFFIIFSVYVLSGLVMGAGKMLVKKNRKDGEECEAAESFIEEAGEEADED
jgi:CDP-diacylglycerol--serine O-phosphatidyltransferase